MSFWIENKYKKKGRTLFLGFSGGQGSGKNNGYRNFKDYSKKNSSKEECMLVLLMIFIKL